MDFITNFIRSFYPSISESTLISFKAILELKNSFKNEYLNSGESFFILKSGVIKSLDTNTTITPKTKEFFITGTTSNTIGSIINLPASKDLFKCLTDAQFYKCNYNALLKLSIKDHQISILENIFLEQSIILKENRLDSLITLDTEKRYLDLLKHTPNLEKLIPKYQIAAYLNITPVQLTRIRKRIIKKQIH